MADRNSVSTNFEENPGGKFENYLKFILNAASNLQPILRQKSDDASASNGRTNEPEKAAETVFVEYLRGCDTVAKLRQQVVEKTTELHRRQLLHAARHVIANDALEERIAILRKIDSCLQSVVANKDYFLDRIHTSPANTPTDSVPVHVSYHESVINTFSEMSNWIKDLETNLNLASLDHRNSDVDDHLSAIVRMTETLLANMNTDVKLIKELQNAVHQLSLSKRNN